MSPTSESPCPFAAAQARPHYLPGPGGGACSQSLRTSSPHVTAALQWPRLSRWVTPLRLPGPDESRPRLRAPPSPPPRTWLSSRVADARPRLGPSSRRVARARPHRADCDGGRTSARLAGDRDPGRLRRSGPLQRQLVRARRRTDHRPGPRPGPPVPSGPWQPTGRQRTHRGSAGAESLSLSGCESDGARLRHQSCWPSRSPKLAAELEGPPGREPP